MVLDYLFPGTNTTRDLSAVPIVRHHETTHALRSRGVQYLDELWAACSYHHYPLQRAIQAYKYRRFSHLHQPLAELVVQASFPQVQNAVLCPVPLHWTRRFWRGFNQAELLAQSISTHYQMPVCPVLRRKKPTGHQAHRTREQRLQAMENMFICREKIDRSTVILVDDIVTTGATLDACAKALKDAGVLQVNAWTVAYD